MGMKKRGNFSKTLPVASVTNHAQREGLPIPVGTTTSPAFGDVWGEKGRVF